MVVVMERITSRASARTATDAVPDARAKVDCDSEADTDAGASTAATPAAGRASPRRVSASASFLRPRCSRAATVPSGQPSSAAASARVLPCRSQSTIAARTASGSFASSASRTDLSSASSTKDSGCSRFRFATTFISRLRRRAAATFALFAVRTAHRRASRPRAGGRTVPAFRAGREHGLERVLGRVRVRKRGDTRRAPSDRGGGRVPRTRRGRAGRRTPRRDRHRSADRWSARVGGRPRERRRQTCPKFLAGRTWNPRRTTAGAIPLLFAHREQK